MVDSDGDGLGEMSSTVELTRNQVGLLEVAALAEGREVRLIVDTGANATVLDRSTAVRLGIGGGDERKETAGCISDSAEMTQVRSLEIGELALAGHRVAVLDLQSVLQRLSGGQTPAAHGILGSDILSSARAVIDYGARELRLTRPVDAAPPG